MLAFRFLGLRIKIYNTNRVQDEDSLAKNDIVEQINENINMHTEIICNIINKCSSDFFHKIDRLSSEMSSKKGLIELKELIRKLYLEQSLKESLYHLDFQIVDICNLIIEMEKIQSQITDSNMVVILEVFIDRLIEILQKSGCKTIENEKDFDIIRHQSIGDSVDDGTHIIRTVRAGVECNGKIYLRAKVIV